MLSVNFFFINNLSIFYLNGSLNYLKLMDERRKQTKMRTGCGFYEIAYNNSEKKKNNKHNGKSDPYFKITTIMYTVFKPQFNLTRMLTEKNIIALIQLTEGLN